MAVVSVTEPPDQSLDEDAASHRPAPARPERRRRPTAAGLVEVGFVALLLVVLVLQLVRYPLPSAEDDEGYPTYARHLLIERSLKPDYPRMPGYPLFMAIAAAVSGPIDTTTFLPVKLAAYRAQLVLAVVFIAAVWLFARAKLGRLPALMLLGIMAAPNYYTRWATGVMADFLYSVIWVPFALFVGYWAFRQRGRRDLLWALPLTLALIALQAVRPNALAMAGLYAVALVGAFALERLLGRSRRGVPLLRVQFWPKLAGLLLAIGVTFFVTDRWLDTGARDYNLQTFHYRVVLYTPPASDSPAERRIEAGKEKFREIEGEPIERTRYGTWRRATGAENERNIPYADVKAVWRDRLLAHPLEFAQSVWLNILWNHYMIVRYVVPFFADIPTLTMPGPYPPEDGSPESNLFRATGLWDFRHPTFQQHGVPALAPLAMLLDLVAVWGLLAIGLRELAKRHRPLTVATTVLFVFQIMFLATFTNLDPRYLLPFAVPTYLAMAVAIVWLLRLLDGRLAAQASPAMAAPPATDR